jgi:hypothetical protein
MSRDPLLDTVEFAGFGEIRASILSSVRPVDEDTLWQDLIGGIGERRGRGKLYPLFVLDYTITAVVSKILRLNAAGMSHTSVDDFVNAAPGERWRVVFAEEIRARGLTL